MRSEEYLKIIEDIFSENGALVRAGGRHNPQQQEYANHIATALARKEAVALCEAQTGIGKSIAYLIPALVHLSLNSQSLPIVISTHTRALQRQLLDKDVPLSIAALREYGLDVPSVAFRMGRQAFFSPSRISDFISSLDEKDVRVEHRELLRFGEASTVSGTGLWMDYIEKYGAFPKGMTAQDVCLLDLMQPDNPAYMHHLEDAKAARLLITNHATVLNRSVFKNVTFHALLCDEAHELEDVCKDLATYKSQLKRISSAISATGSNIKAAKLACELSESLADQLLDFDADNKQVSNLVSDISHASLLNSIQPNVLELHKLAVAVRTKYVKDLDEAPTNIQAKVVDRLDRHINTLRAFDNGSHLSQRRAIAFSDKYREPSIASISLSAGRLFNYRANELTDRVILISATMANANTKSVLFTQITNALGIEQERVTDSCSISPLHFGKMSFVVVPAGKSPIIRDESEFLFDETWLASTSSMIDLAAQSGKTLVLSPSIRESKELAKRISSDYLLQDERNPLMQLTNAFLEGGEPILLSAGAWNGVSFRAKDGGQFLQNIVITRIPFLPVDEAMQFLQREYLLSKGFTEAAIKNIYWTNQQYHTMIKLKQGVGRGIRGPNDDIKVWFADPRMPTQKHSSGLISAIPQRFLEDYYDAEVFEDEEIVSSEPLFYL